MDKYDGDYDIGFDFERCDLSFSNPAEERTGQNLLQNDSMLAGKENTFRRSPWPSTKEAIAFLFSQSRHGKEKTRKVSDNSKNDRNTLRPESNFRTRDRTELGSPLDIYCAEIRRLNGLKPENDHRLQVAMSEVSDSLVDTLSRFPGSARYFIEGCQKDLDLSPNIASQVVRNNDEFEYREGSSEPRFDEVSLLDMDDYSGVGDRLFPSDPAYGTTDSALIQSLSVCLDDVYQAVRQHGIEHPITRQRRTALSEAFCRLPLTRLFIEAQVARLNSLFAEGQQFRERRLAEKNFEQLYAIGFEEFEQIAHKASGLYVERQKIRNRIVEFHAGLAIYLARQYSTDPQELVDLIQEGNIGLIKAVERFDYRLGFRFSTYATYWIRLAISRHLARSGRAVRVPYRQNLQFGTIRKKRERFTQIHGRAPSTFELSKDTGISEAGLRKLETLSQTILSLDSPLEAGENLDLMSMLEQRTFSQPVEVVEKQNMDGLIEKAIGGLNKREAYVIRERFGIGVYAEKTLQELGSVLGITRERVRQIECGALKKIRRSFEPMAIR
ncbi:MAG: sigma-70 family RNA polymerase sigma factor [Methylococcales bacterium]